MSLHLRIFSVAGFEITLAFILIPIWFIHTFKINPLVYKKRELITILLLLIFPFCTSRIYDWSEFFKSYFQFTISYYFVIRSIYKSPLPSKRTVLNTVNIFQWILLLVVSAQFILVTVFKQHQFYNLFGEFQAYYQLDSFKANFRMKAFYLEPSYLGLVILNLYWVRTRLNSNKIDIRNLLLTIGILLLAKSALSYIAFFAITILEYQHFIKTTLRKHHKWIIYAIIAMAIFFTLPFLFKLFRLQELQINDKEQITSGYLRIIHPINILNELLIETKHYTGLTLGQLEPFVDIYNHPYGIKEKGINNAFLALIGYWGILAIIFYAHYFIKFLKTRSLPEKSFIMLIFFNLNNSGAFLPIQFIFIGFLFPLLAMKLANEQQSDN